MLYVMIQLRGIKEWVSKDVYNGSIQNLI